MKEFVSCCILIYIGILSLITFILFDIDKQKAKKHKWHIPEKALLGMCLIGGFVGCFLGMQALRHKTKHWYFYAVIIISVALWAYVLYTLWT